jgi:hypothetical protein
MDYRKLFQVLVVGGAVVGGGTGCNGNQADAAEKKGNPQGSADAGTGTDAGSGGTGGGVQGW